VDGQFQLGPWLVDPSLNIASRNGTAVHLEPKVMEVLVCLARHAGEAVPKEELLKAVWPDTFITDDALKHCISDLRRVLEDDARESHIIQTIPKRGYRLVAPVVPAKRTADFSTQAALNPVNGTSRTGTRRVWAWALGVGSVVLISISLFVFKGRRADVGGLPRIHALAVLPLQNLSADPAQEYFSDGMTDALITDLAQIGSLKVISRTSSMRYKQTKKSLPEIARDLNVDGIVEGTVQRSGDRVRITAQLIYGPSDKHIWASSYERELPDALQLQEEVAYDISQQISANIASLSTAPPASSSHLLDVNAYDDYLKGRNYVSRETTENVLKGAELLQRSIQRDPRYAPALAELAFAHYTLAAGNHFSTGEVLQSKSAALQALALDNNVAEGHCVLALIDSMYDRDWIAADREFKLALESDPGSSFVRSRYAFYLTIVGRNTSAMKQINTALQLDPFSPTMHSLASFVFLYARQYDPALLEARRSIDIDARFAPGHLALSSVMHAKGMPNEAFAEWLRFLSLNGQANFAQELENAATKNSGPGEPLHRVAPMILRHYLQQPNAQSAWPVNVAWAYMFLGDKDKAFQWLNRACDEHALEVYSIAGDPDFDLLRSDARFKDLLRRLNLPGG
jgi:TolB-like protein/DNA-binding winged helix-turn-helix (wHTH) protein/Tfp pilus assembly protein PilF